MSLFAIWEWNDLAKLPHNVQVKKCIESYGLNRLVNFFNSQRNIIRKWQNEGAKLEGHVMANIRMLSRIGRDGHL